MNFLTLSCLSIHITCTYAKILVTIDSIELDNYHILKDPPGPPSSSPQDNAHSTNVHRILTNISNGKQILVGPVLNRLAMALFGNANATATILAYDHNYAYWKMKTAMDSPTIMELMLQCDKLVAFMETTQGDATITRLVDELEYDANTTDKVGFFFLSYPTPYH